jgi:murein L,D-transpeptidase YcbB/YkuD
MIAFHRPAVIAAMVTSALLAGVAWAESPAPGTAAAPSLLADSSQLTPDSLAMRAALTRLADADTPEIGFYESRAYMPFWLNPEGAATPAAAALMAWVGEADSHGLPTAPYGLTVLAGEIATPGQRDLAETARIELSLTRLYLTYARDFSSGLLEPRRISRSIDIKPERPDPTALLQGVAAAPDITVFLDSLAPADPDYDRLRGLYAETRARVAAGGWGPLVDRGRTLRPGDRHPRVAQLRARLAARGFLAPPETAAASENRLASNEVVTDASPSEPDPQLFDSVLEVAVRQFQADQGLNIDGAVGPATLAAINTTLDGLAAQVAVNLERLRWFDIDRASRYVLVNIANFSMQMFENGAPIFETRTVVGKPGKKFQTAEFNDELEYIVVNPFWNVPYSIASKEILPLLQEDPTYLEQNNMVLLDSDLEASEIDWSTISRHDFPGRIRQRPGPGNAHPVTQPVRPRPPRLQPWLRPPGAAL